MLINCLLYKIIRTVLTLEIILFSVHYEYLTCVNLYKNWEKRDSVIKQKQSINSFEANIRICQPENSDVHRGDCFSSFRNSYEMCIRIAIF